MHNLKNSNTETINNFLNNSIKKEHLEQYRFNMSADTNNLNSLMLFNKYYKKLKELISRGTNFKEELGQIHYKLVFNVGSEKIIFENCMRTLSFSSSSTKKIEFSSGDSTNYWKEVQDLVKNRMNDLEEKQDDCSFLSL